MPLNPVSAGLALFGDCAGLGVRIEPGLMRLQTMYISLAFL